MECVWWFEKALSHFRSVGCREDEDGGGENTREKEREGNEMDIYRKESLGYLWVNENMYVQCKDARPPLFWSEI